MSFTLSDIVSASDIVSCGKLPRHSFDGLATGQYDTITNIMDTFIQHQGQMIDYIMSDIAVHKGLKKCFFVRGLGALHITLQKHGFFFFPLEKVQQKTNRLFYENHGVAKEFDRSYKIGIYSNDVLWTSEKDIEWLDSEILCYFRQLGYDTSIDYSKGYGAGVASSLWIRICSK